MDDDTYTITGGPLKPHEWVRIKSYISAADQAWVSNHSATLGGTKKNRQLQMTLGDVKLALVKRMVITWQLTKTVRGPDGSETEVQIPCTEQEIDRLRLKIFNYIHDEIDRLNSDEEDEEEEENGGFLPVANGHSETSLVPMKSTRRKG